MQAICFVQAELSDMKANHQDVDAVRTDTHLRLKAAEDAQLLIKGALNVPLTISFVDKLLFSLPHQWARQEDGLLHCIVSLVHHERWEPAGPGN